MLNESNFIPGIILVNEGRKGRLSQFAPSHFRCGPPSLVLPKAMAGGGWNSSRLTANWDRKNYLKKTAVSNVNYVTLPVVGIMCGYYCGYFYYVKRITNVVIIKKESKKETRKEGTYSTSVLQLGVFLRDTGRKRN